MTGYLRFEKRSRLIQLIRKVAREEVEEALNEHLEDYEHKESKR
jgi:hypothetical protein